MSNQENTIFAAFPREEVGTKQPAAVPFALVPMHLGSDEQSVVPCNAWWSPTLSMGTLLTEAEHMWKGAGGTVEPALLWADHLAALRYQQGLLIEHEQALRAQSWPFQSIADAVQDWMHQTSFAKGVLDLFALGSGAALHEQRLLQALQNGNKFEIIRTFLFDSSLPMLEMGFQRLGAAFPQSEGMQLACVHQQMLQLGQDADWAQAIRHADRAPLVTLLGEMFGSLPNELRFLRHSLGVFPSNTMLLLDATEGYASPDEARNLYKADPFLNGQCSVRQTTEPFLQRLIQDHRPGVKRVHFQTSLDRGRVIVPGSYALEWHARMGDANQFFIPHTKRYQPDLLLKAMEEERWAVVDRWASSHPHSGMYLFVKQPRSARVQVPAVPDEDSFPEGLQQLLLPHAQHASARIAAGGHSVTSGPGYPMNAWMDPKEPSLARLQRLCNLLAGRGGALLSSDLCLDEQASRDYSDFLRAEQEFFTGERFPADTLADGIAAHLSRTPLLQKSIDLMVFARSGGEDEIHLVRSLLQRTAIRDIRLCLVDPNVAYLRSIHEKYTAQFSAVETVQVRSVAVHPAQLHRHPAWITALQQSSRLLVVTTTGDTLSEASNEIELVRNVFRLFPRRSLWLLDVPLVFAPAEQPSQIRLLDPLLARPRGRWEQFAMQWLYGVFQRYRKTPALYSLQTGLDRTAALIPGSYSVDVRVGVDGENSFSVFKRTRYEEAPLLQLLEQSQWSALDGWFYNQGNRLAQLLEKS